MTESPPDPIEALFDQTVDLPPAERTAFLDAACAADPHLRAEVESLLACDEVNSPEAELLDHSPVQRAAPAPRRGPAFGPPTAEGEVGTLGPYRVVRQLGRGGMGAVYAAIDTRLNRQVALKVLLRRFATDPDAKGRFLREAHAAARINHDNVVTIFEADEHDGVSYIAMQLLEGRSLEERLRSDGIPPIPEILRIAREAVHGLAAAHAIGLVHRDVKPSNLWVEAPGGRVKVLDFGLAKPLDARVGVTMTGAVVGTPAYMSPEHARGEPVDHRTDLFSLGAVLYRMCGGRMPFEGPSTMAVLMALGTEDPPPLRELNPAVPAPLAELIHQMLAKSRDARPQSAVDIAVRMRAIAEGKIAPPPPEPPAHTAKRASGVRRRWYAVAAVATLALVASAMSLPLRNREGPQAKTGVPAASLPATRDAGLLDDAGQWESAVARMDANDQVAAVASRLKKLNPTFKEASLSPHIEAGVVVYLEVGDGAAVKDLAPVRALTGLKDLYLHGGFVGAADLAPLRGMKLQSLQSNGCPHTDLSPLKGMPLTKANFWGCLTTDLSPLSGMKLVETNLGNSAIKDISVLKGMPLEEVCLNFSQVDDLSPLAGAPLRSLSASNIKATDLSPIGHAPIESLSLNGTPIEDYAPLLTMRLKTLGIDNPQRHAKLLRRIPTLTTINDKPVAEVLSEVVD